LNQISSDFDFQHSNDTIQFFKILEAYSNTHQQKESIETDDYIEGLINIINEIDGDFAIVYHDVINNKLVLARDFFGKRSLLLALHNSHLIGCSNQIKGVKQYYEIPSNAIIVIDLAKEQDASIEKCQIKLGNLKPSKRRFPEEENE
jgi:asparagine synthetase B (glutamine-hydrolysing)